MNNFVIDTPDNFWQIRWLDKYMEGHKGFIHCHRIGYKRE